MLGFITKFQYWNDISVIPVGGIGESVAVAQASADWAREAIKG